jgi:A/G-specific adenine glycosylase
MELGATVCAPRAPACEQCPLIKVCDAHQQGNTARIPTTTARPPKRVVQMAAVRMHHEGRILLVRRRTGLLAGTWMLPACLVDGRKTPSEAAKAATRMMGIAPRTLTLVGRVRHLFTHRDVTTTVFDASPVKPDKVRAADDADVLWADGRGLAVLAVSSFLRKQIDLEQDKRVESP